MNRIFLTGFFLMSLGFKTTLGQELANTEALSSKPSLANNTLPVPTIKMPTIAASGQACVLLAATNPALIRPNVGTNFVHQIVSSSKTSIALPTPTK